MTAELLALINQRKQAVGRIATLKPSTGRNRYRILPSWRTDDTKGPKAQFFVDFGQHFLKDSAGAIKAVYVCVDKTFGRACSICDELGKGVVAHAHLGKDDPTVKRLNDAKSSGRVLLNVLHLDGPTPNEPQILELAPSAFNGKKGVGGILSLFTDWPNLVALGGSGDGCADVIIEKSGTGLDTAYGVSAVPAQSVLTADHVKRAKDLDKFIAQEDPAGATRALTAVAAVTGLLPNSSAPSLQQLAQNVFDDIPDLSTTVAPAPVAAPAQFGVATPTAAVAALDTMNPFQAAPVISTVPAPAVAAVQQVQAVAAVQVAPAEALDPELQALLDGLN